MWTYLRVRGRDTRPSLAFVVLVLILLMLYLFRGNGPAYNHMPRRRNMQQECRNADDFAHLPNKFPKWQEYLCDRRNVTMSDNNQEGFIPLQVLFRDVVPDNSPNNVFLLETSCKTQPNLREFCSVESWASQNPKANVWYIMTSPYANDTSGFMKSLLKYYPNLRVVSADPERAFKNTPLWDLFNSWKWISYERWAAQQLGNTLRVALIWLLGGFYADTDIICLKEISELHNIVGFQNEGTLNNAIFHGYPLQDFYWKLMEHISNNFKANVWGNNGPTAITKAMSLYCGVESLKELRKGGETVTCSNMTLAPEEVFYPITYQRFRDMFRNGSGKNFDKRFKSSYAMHFWNSLSKNTKVKLGGDSIYDVASKGFCTMTYRHVHSHSTF